MDGREQIIQRVAREMHWWKSIHIETRDTITRSKEAEAVMAKYAVLFTESDYEYLETAEGDRLLSSTHKLADGRSRITKSYFDGHRAATVNYDKSDPTKQNFVSIGRAFAGEDSFGETAQSDPAEV